MLQETADGMMHWYLSLKKLACFLERQLIVECLEKVGQT